MRSSQWYSIKHDDALCAIICTCLMIDCALVTCDKVPNLDRDDRLVATELANRGVSVAAAVWSDPDVDWSNSKTCVLRSTWDYHSRFDEFIEWLDRISPLTTVWNPPELLRWNADKRYLRDLEAVGVRIVPTVWARRGEKFNLYECCEQHGFRDIVIKPARGAATHDVLLVPGDDCSLADGQGHLDRLLREHDGLVQPYLDSVMSYGERALVFFENRFSHAVIKKPFDKVLAVRGSAIPVVDVTLDEIELAIKALTMAPGRPLYARVDLLRDSDGEPCVSEVELIEPGLYFGACAQAVSTFADLLEREIHTAGTRCVHPTLAFQG
jgi:glutathione synthase/RimK-type ligase-like ATP-grasp enzyme